jgi:hypothetical protein
LTFLAVPLLVPRNLCGWESFTLAAFGLLHVSRLRHYQARVRSDGWSGCPAGWGVLADDLVAGLAAAVFVSMSP